MPFACVLSMCVTLGGVLEGGGAIKGLRRVYKGGNRQPHVLGNKMLRPSDSFFLLSTLFSVCSREWS